MSDESAGCGSAGDLSRGPQHSSRGDVRKPRVTVPMVSLSRYDPSERSPVNLPVRLSARPPIRILLGTVMAACLAMTLAVTLPTQSAASTTMELSNGGWLIDQTPPVLVQVQVNLSLSSNWSVVRLVDVPIVDYRVRSTTEGVTIAPADDGWGMQVAAGGGSAEIDAIIELPTSDVTLRAENGWLGEATATVRSGTADPVTVTVPTYAWPAVATTNVPQDTFAAGIVQPPRADPRPLALAHYYPWFTEYGNPDMAEKPADPRPATDPAGVLSMTEQARAHGVDGFLVSWRDNLNDGAAYDLALQAAEQTNGYVAPTLEMVELSNRSDTTAELAAQVHDSLSEAYERTSSPAVLRSEGAMVVFAFETKLLPAAAWRDVLATLTAEGRPVRLVGDWGGDWSDNQWGVHSYIRNDSPETLAAHWRKTAMAQRADDLLDGTSHLVTATVTPGYNDTKLGRPNSKVVPRNAGLRYEATWRATSGADPDWILITSWNEWFENTNIEPGTTTGGQALQQTAQLTADWKAR